MNLGTPRTQAETTSQPGGDKPLDNEDLTRPAAVFLEVLQQECVNMQPAVLEVNAVME